MGIGEMRLCAPAARRPHRGLPSPDARGIDRQRKEDVRVSNDIVIEEIARVRPEVIEIDCPAARGDCDSHLILFVTLALERQKPESLVHCKVEQRSGHRRQGRSLIVPAIRASHGAFTTRQADRRAHSRAHGGLGDGTRKARHPHAAVQSQPAGRRELIFRKDHFDVTGGHLCLIQRCSAGTRLKPEQDIILLMEPVHAHPAVVLST